MSANSSLEHDEKLHCWGNPLPEGADDLAPLSCFSNGLTGDNALRPAEANLGKVEVCVMQADVVKDASDSLTDPGVEAFGRIDVDRATHIFPFAVTNGVVSNEAAAEPR